MPIARFKMEDGRVARFEVPEGTTPEQAQSAFKDWQSTQVKPGKSKADVVAELEAQEAHSKNQGGIFKNIAGGALRGAADIGATIIAPGDWIADRLIGDRAGQPSRNQERRQAMDEVLDGMGFDTGSVSYGAGRIGGQIAGTAGAGGAVAGGLRAVPAIANSARLAPVVDAVATSGMRAGGVTGAKGLATRAAGGALAGGLQAGMIDPSSAGTGAAIGGALPVGMKAAGKVGSRVASVVRGADQTPEAIAAAQAARSAGYVIPPTQVKPSLLNRTMEGFAGKLTTAQNASAKNQTVTNRLVAKELGLPEDAAITPDALANIRRAAGQAYEAIGQSGTVTPGKAYAAALDRIDAPFVTAAQGFPNAAESPVLGITKSLRSPSFDASAAVEKIKQLRTAADDAFRSGNTDVARASKSAAAALEDALEDHLKTIGNPGLLQGFRNSRQLIAKTYSVEKAMNPATGSIDAKKLAAQLAKGKPLSGNIKSAAEFAARFPKAAQTVEQMGSLPQLSPLDWAVGGGMSAASANPLMMAGVMARPVVRAATLSGPVQNRLAQQPTQNALSRLLTSEPAEQMLYLGAPVTGVSR
jgi:hypothetical protein